MGEKDLKSKKRVLSLVLLLSMFVSGLGLSNTSKAEDEIAPEQETTVTSEQISEEEGKEIFEEGIPVSDGVSMGDEVAPLEDKGQESLDITEEDTDDSGEKINEDNNKEKLGATNNGTEEVVGNSNDDGKAKAEDIGKQEEKKR